MAYLTTQPIARSQLSCTRPTRGVLLCARAPVHARWTRLYSREQQRIHPAVEPGAWSREKRTEKRERATEDGRSGIVRSWPGRVHYRPDCLRQTAADHPQSAVLGESGFSRHCCYSVCLCVCGCVCGGCLLLLRETRDVFSLQI